jgi:hypothetical protein
MEENSQTPDVLLMYSNTSRSLPEHARNLLFLALVCNILHFEM